MTAKKATAKPRAKPKKKAKAKIAPVKADIFPYATVSSEVENSYRLSSEEISSMDNEFNLSTDLLMYDLIIGNNGLKAGTWLTFFGKEQTAKSTAKSQLLIASVKNEIPINWDCDYEGSTDVKYLYGMSGILPENIYGRRVENSDKWEITPRAHYYSLSSAETFFESASALLRRLPDVEKVAGQWYYVLPNGKKADAFIKIHPDNKKLYTKSGNKYRYIPRKEGGRFQAMFFLDSYSNMNPNDAIEEEDKGAGLASKARMFSEQIGKVSAKLRAKRACVIGVNQLRQKPLSMGCPDYEPNGEALKFASHIRILKQQLSHKNKEIKGAWDIEEDSLLDGGKDSYLYIKATAIKNKTAIAKLVGWLRIWTKDSTGLARGYDPYFDVFQYLFVTGQITGSKGKYKLSFRASPTADEVAIPKFSQEVLKTLVLYPYYKEIGNADEKKVAELEKHYHAILETFELPDNLDIRALCFEQLHSSLGYKMHYHYLYGDDMPLDVAEAITEMDDAGDKGE